MTSKFSIDNRELLQRSSSGEAVVGIDFGNLIARELAAFRLAAMDSEPVGEVIERPCSGEMNTGMTYRRVKGLDEMESMPVGTKFYAAQPAPVVPDGYVMLPMRLTAENGAKGALSGEFSETKFVNCPECFGDDECETCDGSGRIEITVPVTWTTIKEIWAKGVEHFAAAPQSPGSETATVPGKWIPVSERMPEKNQNVLISVNFDSDLVEPLICSARYTGSTFRRGEATVKPGAGIEEATHWMPLPAAPQEGK